jgi:hypothetical protein
LRFIRLNGVTSDSIKQEDSADMAGSRDFIGPADREGNIADHGGRRGMQISVTLSVSADRGSPDFFSWRKGTTRIASRDFGSKEREAPISQSSLVPFDGGESRIMPGNCGF